MTIEFDKDDKKEIRETLDVILKDLRSIYDSSSSDELKASFSIPKQHGSIYNLCVKKSIICFCCQDELGSLVLERRNGFIKRPKINDYESIYGLLDQYDEIRKMIEEQALESSYDKEVISKRLQEIRDKYSHETTVEIDLAGTNNQRTVEIREEEGNAIGEIRFGSDTIRLITKGSIVVATHETEKVKRK